PARPPPRTRRPPPRTRRRPPHLPRARFPRQAPPRQSRRPCPRITIPTQVARRQTIGSAADPTWGSAAGTEPTGEVVRSSRRGCCRKRPLPRIRVQRTEVGGRRDLGTEDMRDLRARSRLRSPPFQPSTDAAQAFAAIAEPHEPG